MNSPINEPQMCIERENEPRINAENKTDERLFSQIENLIQQEFQITLPILIFEYRPSTNVKDISKWDYDDLYEFFSHFGEIEHIEIHGKVSLILFKTFLDAYTSREFLLNSANYKECERNNFLVRWYTPDDEFYVSDSMRMKIMKVSPGQIVESINTSMNNINGKNGIDILNGPSYYGGYFNQNQNSNEYFATSNIAQYNYYANFTLSQGARDELNSVIDNTIGKNEIEGTSNISKPYMANDKYLTNGKYTCKFEIQIENDNEFQVARRLIGAKVKFPFTIQGCNMKKIVDHCSWGPDGKFIPDAVKLRLRGRGSGYKEGPYNRESDENLHLCVSSKYYDKYRHACILVHELLVNVYEEYKRFCERNYRTPITNLTIQKIECVSSRRNNASNSMI